MPPPSIKRLRPILAGGSVFAALTNTQLPHSHRILATAAHLRKCEIVIEGSRRRLIST
jgi:hypothetical protein